MKKFFILLLLACICSVVRAADVEFPLIQSMGYFPYSHHSTLAKNDFRVSLDFLYSNIHTYDYGRTRLNDMETFSGTLGIGYGLTGRVTLELYYRAAAVFGGILDGVIVDIHKALGLPVGGREDTPRNRVAYTYEDAFSYTGGTLGQSPLVLGALARIYSSGSFHLNGRLALGLPLSSKPGFSSNKPFLGAGIALLYRKGKLAVDFSNHIAVFTNPGWLAGEDLRNRVFHSELRVDYKRVFIGFLYRSAPFRTEELSRPAYQLYLGVKIWKYFEFAFVEELPPMDTTPDVSLHLRVNLSRFLGAYR